MSYIKQNKFDAIEDSLDRIKYNILTVLDNSNYKLKEDGLCKNKILKLYKKTSELIKLVVDNGGILISVKYVDNTSKIEKWMRSIDILHWALFGCDIYLEIDSHIKQDYIITILNKCLSIENMFIKMNII